MKLRLDEYYYILGDYEWEELEKYMPKEIADKFNEFKKSQRTKAIGKTKAKIQIFITFCRKKQMDKNKKRKTWLFCFKTDLNKRVFLDYQFQS